MSARKPCRLCDRTTADETGVCSICRRRPAPDIALPEGRWIGGMVKRYVVDPTLIHTPRIDQRDGWSDTELRDAHRRYMTGDRDDETCEGERVYNRMNKRRSRARRRENGTQQSDRRAA